MNKVEYFNKAIKTNIYKDVQWIISLLSYTHFKEDPSGLVDYSLKYQYNKCYYYLDKLWIPFEDDCTNRGLFVYNEQITLYPNTLENAPNGIESTTIGRVLQNKIMLCTPFKDKIPFINNRFMPSDIEDIIVKRLKDTPPIGATRKHEDIYVDEYIEYNECVLFLGQLTQVCVPGVTEKAITPPPNAEAKLKELLEKNKDRLKDPVTIAEIGKEMELLDQQYLEGDRSLGFLINKKKDLSIVRKKMYLTYGFDNSFDDNPEVDYIPNPLSKGIDYSKIDSYINGSRSGSYSRGAETQLGGVAVKELLRASSNLSIVTEDCGSTKGINTLITEKNKESFIGFTIIESNKNLLLTKENINQFVDKTVSMRTPAFCREPDTDFCATCCGPRLSLHTHGISSAIASMGSVFLNTFMKAMHGKVLASKELDFDKLIT